MSLSYYPSNTALIYALLLLTIFVLKGLSEENTGVSKKVKNDKPVNPSTKKSKVGSRLNTETIMAESKKKPVRMKVSSTAQASSGAKMTADMAEELVGLEWYTWCGCGDDSCEKNTKCAKSAFQPICCNSRCKCVKVESAFEWEDYWKSLKPEMTCKLLGCYPPMKTSCYDATPTEFNCWTQYRNETDYEDSEKVYNVGGRVDATGRALEADEIDQTIQFAYFGCNH